MTLGGFYFLLMGANGLLMPFYTLYFKNLGFSAMQVGLIAAIGPLGRVLFPAPWGYLTDRMGGRHRILILASLACAVSWAAVLAVAATKSLGLLLFTLTIFTFF